MGIKTRTSFKVAPGMRVNLNKKSTSITVGNKYIRQTFSTADSKPKRTVRAATQKEASPITLKICGIICLVFGIPGALIGLISFPVGGWLIVLLSLPLLCLGWMMTKKPKQNNKGE